MHVDIAADVLLFDKAGQRARGGGFDLATILAQLGRDPVEVEGAVDVFLSGGGDLCTVIEAGERIFTERVAALERALAHGDVVHFGAGEVLQRCAEGSTREKPDVDLQSGAKTEADLVLAFRDELRDRRIGGGVVDGARDDVFFAGGAGDEHVEIADGVAATAERARRGDAFDAGKIFQIESKTLGGGFCVIEMEAAAILAVFVDAFAELLDELVADAREVGQAAFVDGDGEVVDGGDAGGFEDKGDGLGAHAGKFEQLKHGGLVAGEQLVTQRHRAVLLDRLDVGDHAFADAGNLEQAFGIVGDGGERDGALLDGFGGATVGADAEGVACADLEQICGFGEELCDGAIFHVLRCGMVEAASQNFKAKAQIA